MAKLSDFYTDFSRIDLDALGGYARVADVVARQGDGTVVHRAFKLMRHELDGKQVGFQRFENELKILTDITKDKNAPPAITRIYDSGFAEAEFSKSLHELRRKDEKLIPAQSLEIISTGIDIHKFLEMKSTLMANEPDRWLPYLVVDLAPYDDSLSRQIKVQAIGDKVNLFVLPVHTVADMGMQLLDVLDYMHRKLRIAYIDWKPEHIYWNEMSRQLKLIDWNVTTRLNGGPEERELIHEDLRMFSGAALYCSLALSDPEELTKPIGLALKIPKDKTPRIVPRYWTDKPNFYQRGEILDDDIKQLIQKALDPSQGFTSPQELKNAFFQYLEKNYRQVGRDAITGLPNEAVQHFRRARSYIAAKDYAYASYWLELAVATARKVWVIYLDAEQLLENVRDIIQDITAAEEVKQQVKPVLEKESWKEALDLYVKAVEADPENVYIKKECDGLQDLLHIESKLQQKRLFRVFTNLFRLRSVLDASKDIVNPENPLYKYVNKQYDQIRIAQVGGGFILLIFVLFTSMSAGKLIFPALMYPATAITTTATFPPTPTPTGTLQPTTIATFINTPFFTSTVTVTPTPTITPLAYGKLEAFYFKPYDEPNKNILTDVAVQRNQFLTILAEKVDGGVLWYKCAWEIDGVVYQGWILADRIKIIPAPTAIPTSFVLENIYGVLGVTSYKPYNEPNRILQDVVLKENQPLKILRGQEFDGALWYECEWEIDGVVSNGWILNGKITIVQPPTPTATP
jgi:tetratricopeptide (TPR) repeat protein